MEALESHRTSGFLNLRLYWSLSWIFNLKLYTTTSFSKVCLDFKWDCSSFVIQFIERTVYEISFLHDFAMHVLLHLSLGCHRGIGGLRKYVPSDQIGITMDCVIIYKTSFFFTFCWDVDCEVAVTPKYHFSTHSIGN